MKNDKNKIYKIGFLILLLILCMLFPYTGDDWAWGSTIGLERLATLFKNYNGRYAGNIIVLILSRFKFLRIICVSLVLYFIVYFQYILINKKKFTLFLLDCSLLLLIPKSIFREAVVWTSGFTNYALPTFLIILYFVMINRKLFSKLTIFFMFILGFITALFVEHITIYIIVINILLLLYTFIKNKKYKKFNQLSKYISYLIGATLGAILMFSNGAYRSIINNTDTYRDIPTSGINSIISKFRGNFQTIYYELIFKNVLLNLFISLLLIFVIYKYYVKNKKIISVKLKYLLNIIFLNIIGYNIYSLLKNLNPMWEIFLNKTAYFELFLSILFFISILLVPLICIEKKEFKKKIFFLWLSIGILTVPLFVVSPIGGRCFFPCYVMFMFIALILYDYLFNKEDFAIKKIFCFIIVVCFIYMVSIYGYVFKIDFEREKYFIEKAKEGEKVIEVVSLPYSDYVWNPDPVENTWSERYKLFYEVDKDIEIKIISLDKWKAIKKDFK